MVPTKSEFDAIMMSRCLDLARRAEGRTAPNPMVGAVVLDKEGKLAGEGFHPRAGEPHAEVFALDQAGENSKGGTLYVNLEPCSHFGKTPPCADRVIASKVSRVVVGVEDPNPKVAGQGIAKLRAAGIQVDFSELKNECLELNRAFFKFISTGLPWLTLKMASTLDGRIADRNGKSRWISGAEARHYVQCLRNTHDCVLVGGKTAIVDDPELNVRDIEGGRDPHRAVLDPSLNLSPQARLCHHKNESAAWTSIFYDAARVTELPKYPERVRLVDLSKSKEQDRLKASCLWLAEQGVLSVLCEGGGRLAASLLKSNLVDEVCWIVAPKLFADAQSIASLSGDYAVPVDSCLNLVDASWTQLGENMLVRGKLRK